MHELFTARCLFEVNDTRRGGAWNFMQIIFCPTNSTRTSNRISGVGAQIRTNNRTDGVVQPNGLWTNRDRRNRKTRCEIEGNAIMEVRKCFIYLFI